MKRFVSIAGAAVLITASPFAHAGSYDELGSLLIDAIDHGSAFGALRGSVGDSLTTKLHANGPVYVTAHPIADLPRVGCKRLDVLFDIRGVQTAAGETSGRLDMKMNFCRDRVPPIGLAPAAATSSSTFSQ